MEAVCVSRARTALCGGCRVTGIPTATPIEPSRSRRPLDHTVFVFYRSAATRATDQRKQEESQDTLSQARSRLFPKTIGLVMAAVLGCGLSVLAIGGAFCAATLHVRKGAAHTPPNAQDLELVAFDGARLRAWWMRPVSQNGNCVVVLHGIKESRRIGARFAPMFLSQGYSVLVPDSRAHGESGGEFVTYGLLEKYDVAGWAHWMAANGCRKNYALGESLGASILIQASALEPVFAAVVAESPYADLREVADYRLRRLFRLPTFVSAPVSQIIIGSGIIYARAVDGLDLRQASPVASVAHNATPILLIHGLADIKTPPSQSKELAAANPRDPLWLVPNASHTGAAIADPEEFRRQVLAWFRAH